MANSTMARAKSEGRSRALAHPFSAEKGAKWRAGAMAEPTKNAGFDHGKWGFSV